MRKRDVPRRARNQAAVAPGEQRTLPFLPAEKPEQPLVLVLIAVALSLRLALYFSNHSLSVDEASLALNIMHRSYSNLLGHLDFNQAAPAGFLLLQKLVVEALGATPYALRLTPLVAGLVASLLIYPIATRFVGRKPAIVALALFAVSEPLISYASTNKQYSVDVAVTLGLYAVAIVLPTRTRGREAMILALAGAAAVWLSHPAAFVLAALGTVLIFQSVTGRHWSETAMLIGVIMVWLLSFLLAYALTRSSVEQVRHSIVSSNPSTLEGRPGLLQTYGGMARSLLGIPNFAHGVRSAIAVAAILLALLGLAGILRARARHAVILVFPAAVALTACAMHLYPLYPRTFLFLIPALVILVSAGAGVLNDARRGRFAPLLAAAAVAIIVSTSAYATINTFHSAPEAQTAQALRHLAQNGRSGDSLYVYASAQYDFRYYLECGCFGTSSEIRKARSLWPIRAAAGHAQFAPALRSAPPLFIAGKATGGRAEDYRSDFRALLGRGRVWVLIIDASPNAERGLEAFLANSGTRKASLIHSSNRAAASLFLYDLRPSS